jgi:oligopeptide/dipeptide ABC transporter ATP-binding protein
MKDIIEIQNLNVNYLIKKNENVYALKDINLKIKKGETVAIVGESGCGKTTLANSLIKLFTLNAEYYGSIKIDEEEILNKREKELQKVRGEKIGMIFQEPGASLNPVFSIKEQIEETIKEHKEIKDKAILKNMSINLLKEAGLKDAERIYNSYPHQLSGGEQQRVMIAIALSCSPQILIADEPTTALDVTVQAQIIKLLKNLKEKRKLTTILITHDLYLAMELAERIIVMYAGEIVEDNFIKSKKDAKHPYTRALFEIIPDIKSNKKVFKVIPGDIEDMREIKNQCYFANRCKYAKKICFEKHPGLKKEKNYFIRCYFPVKR